MSAPVRFLALVVVGWGIVRAATVGAISGFTVSEAKPMPKRPAFSPKAPPGEGMSALASYWADFTAAEQPRPVQVTRIVVPRYIPVYISVPEPPEPVTVPDDPAWQLSAQHPSSPRDLYPSLPAETSTVAFADFPGRRSTPLTALSGAPLAARVDRWQVSSWALLRGASVPDPLATGGTLGGSQAGVRVLYNFTHSLAASVRTSSAIGGSADAEVAGGIRWAPLRSVPVAITAERRQSIRSGGRSAFALFVEGGVYQRRMPFKFRLDGYAQAGIVGIRRRDLFADGELALTRPVWGRFSAGFGVWGGAQPGLYRVDAGPRISMRIQRNIYARVDWRQRVAGSARPSSGPALTVAADF